MKWRRSVSRRRVWAKTSSDWSIFAFVEKSTSCATFSVSMASSRAKRILGIAKDTENALPIQEDAKRSKCRSTSPDLARNENTPVEHVAFKTPKATR